MDSNKIEVLVRAVELGSLLKTADKLGYTQAGLTHMMNSLENELGVTLLNRGKFGIRLTEEGERLMPLFKELVKVNKKISTEVNSMLKEKASIISIGAISSVIRTWLPDVMLAFQKEYPEVSFEIKEGSLQMYSWIEQGNVDICITSNIEESIEFIPLMRDFYSAVLPPDYPIEYGQTFPLEKIQTEKFIFPSCFHDRDVERLLGEYKVKPNSQNTYVDDGGVISMVSKGFGISVLPDLILKNTHDKIKIAELDKPCYRNIGLIYNKNSNTSAAVKNFVSFLKKWKF